jgi:hypothetical protein
MRTKHAPLIQVYEWSPEDSNGDRQDLGPHLYSEEALLRIVDAGGCAEYRGQCLDNASSVYTVFENIN